MSGLPRHRVPQHINEHSSRSHALLIVEVAACEPRDLGIRTTNEMPCDLIGTLLVMLNEITQYMESCTASV
jgi:hypothetical protein